MITRRQGGSDTQPPYSPLTKGDRGLYIEELMTKPTQLAFECDFV